MLNVDKIQERTKKFLQMAGHPSTGEAESLAAVRHLRRWADANGVTISDLRFAPTNWPKNADPFMRDRIRDLEHEADAASEKMKLQAQLIEVLSTKNADYQAKVEAQAELINELVSKNEDLQKRLEADATSAVAEPTASVVAEPAATSDCVPLGPIVEQIVRKTGRKHITTAAAHALGIPVVEMRAWTVVKTMPAKLAHKLASLPVEALAAASRKRWSDAELVSLEMLVAQGLDNLAIALALSKQFGRRIFEGTVSRARSKLVMAELGQRCRSGTGYGAAYH